MRKLSSLAGILDFFIPAEVLSAVLLVFTMENVLDYVFSTYIHESMHGVGWISIYLIGIISISVLNFVTADEEERDDLEDDIENL